ncbi:hypothetical protein VP01_1386g1 [Puccinia sorghi]|uniref:Uncharacterized protein n=1 Tax=Puccinia sorghi TaxID=27349 RepID=A0A0L6VL86_9BASI|nr:hypothetical protein VP01_1386g1 [Puccinia sorghi]
MACERLTGSSKVPVFIYPANPNQFIPFTVDWVAVLKTRISPWRGILDNFMVPQNLSTPVQLLNEDATSTSPSDNPSAATSLPFYPTTNMNPIYGYMCYDLVTPSRNCQGFPQLGDYLQPPHLCTFPIILALGELGINHYSQFQNFQEELEEAGMKRANSKTLISR